MFESIMSGQVLFRTMTLTGQGRVTLMPDIAVIRLGVQMTGADLAEVQSQNAMQSQAVLAALHRMGVTDIRTYQYTIDKYYENINGTSVDRGYTVRNIMEIRTKDIGQTGAIIDAAVQAGANVVDLISFEVSDPEHHYLEALDLAVADAIKKAKSIAAELGIQVDPIPVSITETSTIPRPIQPFQRELAATPIVPGNVTVEADISAEFAY
jgi:uncharacterized protein YggE